MSARRWSCLILAIALAGAGCGRREPPRALPLFHAGDYSAAFTEQKRRVQGEGPERDQPLELMRLGMCAFEAGDPDAAIFLRKAVDAFADFSRSTGETVAGSTFGSEASAYFRGHPYERMLVLAYYGLAEYAKPGRAAVFDAMAGFNHAIREDYAGEIREAYEKTPEGREQLAKDPDFFKCDSAFAHFMVGMCHLRVGESDLAKAAFADARKQAAKLTARGYPAVADEFFDAERLAACNLLVITALGRAPVKYRVGQYGEFCRIRPGDTVVEARARVSAGGVTLDPPVPLEDVFHQASTRGGRAMDAINRGKAVFKAGTGEAAVGLTYVGLAVMSSRDRDTQAAGAVIAGVGLLAGALSALSKPDADVRCLELLPATLQVLPARLPPGRQDVVIEFIDRSGAVIPGQTVVLRDLEVPAEGNRLVYVRSGPHRAPTPPPPIPPIPPVPPAQESLPGLTSDPQLQPKDTP
ncbi:MAG: hypothetical protein H0W72_06425 [Planctomycetes bacterium]|nr:hypothetical protein [Planctomycetota bacterium]